MATHCADAGGATTTTARSARMMLTRCCGPSARMGASGTGTSERDRPSVLEGALEYRFAASPAFRADGAPYLSQHGRRCARRRMPEPHIHSLGRALDRLLRTFALAASGENALVGTGDLTPIVYEIRKHVWSLPNAAAMRSHMSHVVEQSRESVAEAFDATRGVAAADALDYRWFSITRATLRSSNTNIYAAGGGGVGQNTPGLTISHTTSDDAVRGDGLSLDGVDGASVTSSVFSANDEFGIGLFRATNSLISGVQTTKYGMAGIYLSGAGTSSSAATATRCRPPPSTRIMGPESGRRTGRPATRSATTPWTRTRPMPATTRALA
jgi:hypothetical protein